jgi:hypothetical protein
VGVHEGWQVQVSRDGERWRDFGTAWVFPNEDVFLHGASEFVRVRPEDGEWSEPMRRESDYRPMTLIRLRSGTREDLFPSHQHYGMPVLLRGGEGGRLQSYETDGDVWTWTVQFRGSRER